MACLPLLSKTLFWSVPVWFLAQAQLSVLLLAAPPDEITTFLSENCKECHNASEKAGGLDLDALAWSFKFVSMTGWFEARCRQRVH